MLTRAKARRFGTGFTFENRLKTALWARLIVIFICGGGQAGPFTRNNRHSGPARRQSPPAETLEEDLHECQYQIKEIWDQKTALLPHRGYGQTGGAGQ
jgi:hypothetical protein